MAHNNAEPYVIPDVTFSVLRLLLILLVRCRLSWRKLFIHLFTCPIIPQFSTLLGSLMCIAQKQSFHVVQNACIQTVPFPPSISTNLPLQPTAMFGNTWQSVKRFELSNGLDTALYKTIPFTFYLFFPAQNQALHITDDNISFKNVQLSFWTIICSIISALACWAYWSILYLPGSFLLPFFNIGTTSDFSMYLVQLLHANGLSFASDMATYKLYKLSCRCNI